MKLHEPVCPFLSPQPQPLWSPPSPLCPLCLLHRAAQVDPKLAKRRSMLLRQLGSAKVELRELEQALKGLQEEIAEGRPPTPKAAKRRPMVRVASLLVWFCWLAGLQEPPEPCGWCWLGQLRRCFGSS
jgi:hypothetical protein